MSGLQLHFLAGMTTTVLIIGGCEAGVRGRDVLSWLLLAGAVSVPVLLRAAS